MKKIFGTELRVVEHRPTKSGQRQYDPIPFNNLSKHEQETLVAAGMVRKGEMSDTAFELRYGNRPEDAENELITVAERRLDGAYREKKKADLPEINASDHDLSHVSEIAWGALGIANHPEFVFRYGGLLARIERDDSGIPVPRILNQDRLRHILARCAKWYTLRKSKDGIEKISAHPPLAVVRDMLVRPEPPLPILMRILEVPVFASDGTLLDKPGYHAVAKIFIQAQQRLEMAPIPKHPTAKDVAFACESIDELIGDFPFTSQSEKANAIALMLLPFARELIDGPTPLHLIEKPAPGTGGSLLAEILTIPAMGRPASILSEGRDDDEWRKRITAKLLTGPIVILLDNIRRRLESSALSAAITAAVWEDRLLGHTDMIRVPVRCVWIATGNNPAMSAEIARRTIRIRLDAQVDRPWMRTNFRHPYLREWAIEHRAEIVWSLLTLVQTWIAAGRPEENITLGMFDRWAHVLGGILKVAGISGFLANLEELYDRSDAESSAWRSFVNSWWNQFQDQEVGVADLYPVVMPSDGDPIDLGLGDGNERSQKIRLGKRLMDMRDRQFDAFRILEAGMRDRAQRWHLIRVHQG